VTFRKRVKRWLYGSCPGLAGRFPYFGVQVFFPPQSRSFHAACEQGIYEAEIVRLLQQLTRPESYLFDVGGNIGLMSVAVLQHCPRAVVVTFEPSPSSIPFLRRTISGSGLAARWRLVERALSDHAGELPFVVGSPADSLFEGFRSDARLPGARSISVPVSTLDAEWIALGRPDVSVIKIDVEGADGLVLDGGRELLDHCRPHVVLEWCAAYLDAFGTPVNELLVLARRHGYRVYSMPECVPVADERDLAVQMLTRTNFLLSP
jgi:FkbM family methyltransferase